MKIQPQIKVIFAPSKVGKHVLAMNVWMKLNPEHSCVLNGGEYLDTENAHSSDPLNDILLKKPKYLVVNEYKNICLAYPDTFRNILLALPEIQIFCVQTWTSDDFRLQDKDYIQAHLNAFALNKFDTNDAWTNVQWSNNIPKSYDRMVESGSMLWKYFNQEIYCETFRYNDTTLNKIPREFDASEIFKMTLKENWIRNKRHSPMHLVADLKKSKSKCGAYKILRSDKDVPYTDERIDEIMDDGNYKLFAKNFEHIIFQSELFPKLKNKYICLEENTKLWEITSDIIFDIGGSKDNLFLKIKDTDNWKKTIRFSLPIIYAKYFTKGTCVTLEKVWEIILNRIATHIFLILQQSKDNKVSRIIPRLCKYTGNLIMKTIEEDEN